MTVHPRGHGEHLLGCHTTRNHSGSSPWARGTHSYSVATLAGSRFIPVGTGNTCHSRPSSRLWTVHPRGHGEHCHTCKPCKFVSGSSPWARGTQFYPGRGRHLSRFIPVGTGNTNDKRTQYAVLAVHPRGHGEHMPFFDSIHDPRGSSPWARGTRSQRRATSTLKPVHPRGHGEHLSRGETERCPCGSSPWARGTPNAAGFYFSPCRFIPVGTGNTNGCCAEKSRRPVHPRGHGEHPSNGQRGRRFCGSSPWARGTLIHMLL